jgi:hypothetical protein
MDKRLIEKLRDNENFHSAVTITISLFILVVLTMFSTHCGVLDAIKYLALLFIGAGALGVVLALVLSVIIAAVVFLISIGPLGWLFIFIILYRH